jgi:hypothetical protein
MQELSQIETSAASFGHVLRLVTSNFEEHEERKPQAAARSKQHNKILRKPTLEQPTEFVGYTYRRKKVVLI